MSFSAASTLFDHEGMECLALVAGFSSHERHSLQTPGILVRIESPWSDRRDFSFSVSSEDMERTEEEILSSFWRAMEEHNVHRTPKSSQWIESTLKAALHSPMPFTAIFHFGDILSEICKARKQWGLYLSDQTRLEYSDPTHITELHKSVPFLSREQVCDLYGCGEAFLFFHTEEECRIAYEQVVGDDGPTDRNPYNGSGRAYALTCDPTGRTRNENT